ncbi:putative heat shock protein 70 family, peptide-binding domain protein [Tanacetum coccineum]
MSKRIGRTAVGIDLGTTYSCVAAWFDKHNRVEMIPNEQGNKITPSCVACDGTQILVGEAAKNQINRNPKNTVFDVKRLMGSGFNDSKVHEDIKSWPFKVIEGTEGKPLLVFEHESQEKKFSPQDISALILKNLKETAEAYLGTKVTDAVITVPAYFNNEQRQATKDAGQLAGLNVMRLIRTFDVSLLNISKDGTFRAVGGDTHLGGEDFDKMMVNYCVQEFRKKENKDVRINARAMMRLKVASCGSCLRDGKYEQDHTVEDFYCWWIDTDSKVKDLILLDVTPLSLGIRVRGDIMSVVIPKNTRIPAMKKRVFETSVDNHTSANFCVFEGESKDTNENTMLGSFVIHGIPAAPEGQQFVKACFKIDANGIVNVSAEVMSTGNKTSITIKDKKCMIIEEKKNKSTRTDQDKGDTWIDNLIRKILRTKSNHQ